MTPLLLKQKFLDASYKTDLIHYIVKEIWRHNRQEQLFLIIHQHKVSCQQSVSQILSTHVTSLCFSESCVGVHALEKRIPRTHITLPNLHFQYPELKHAQ